MASLELSELNHIDKPNDAATNWAFSLTDTIYLNFTKRCLEHIHFRLSLLSKQKTNTFAIKHYCRIETINAGNNSKV